MTDILYQPWAMGPASLTLAQDTGSGVLGSPDGQSAGAVPAGGGAGGTTKPSSPFSGMFPLLLLAMLGFIILTTMSSSRKEKKKRKALLSSIKKQDRVQTVGGVIGRVIELKETELVLKVDEPSDTRIRFARTAIQQILSSGRGDGADSFDDMADDTVEDTEPAGV